MQRWWSGEVWTEHVAPAPVAPPRKRRPGVLGAAVILVGTFGLWLFAACAELFWYHEHGSRLVIVSLASLPSGAALLWVMTRRLRPSDRMSPWLLVLVAVAGGFVALIVPSLVEPPWERWLAGLHMAPFAPAIAGPLEETVKLAAVAVAARWLTVRTARTGLFLGGAVGAGYAVLENIDYASSATARGSFDGSPAEHFAVMLHVAIERNLLTPFAHPLWTALAAAALFAGSRGGRLRITRLAVGAWALVAVVHSLWDEVPEFFPDSIMRTPLLGLAAGFGWCVVLAAVGFVIWRIVVVRANRSALAAEQAVPISD